MGPRTTKFAKTKNEFKKTSFDNFSKKGEILMKKAKKNKNKNFNRKSKNKNK